MAEDMITLPKEYADYSTGFALDSGGSVIKVVYRSKEDYDKGNPKHVKNDMTVLRTRSFARDEYSQAVDFLRANCDMLPADNQVAVHTGVGIQHFVDKLEEAFQTKVVCASEFDGASTAITTLVKRMQYDDVFEPVSIPAMAHKLQRLQIFLPFFAQTATKEPGAIKMAKKISKEGIEKQQKMQEAIQMIMANPDPVVLAEHYLDNKEVFPCLCVVCGSAFAMMIFEEDRATAPCDMSTRGGRMFLGLGKALCGAQTYGDLVAMAERGDRSKVDVSSEELKAAGNDKEGDLYAAMPDGIPVFAFGKLHDSNYEGTYSKDDLAAAILHSMVLDVVSMSVLNAVYRKITSVVFCGSFLNHPYVQKIVWQCFQERTFAYPPDEAPVMRIMKRPGHVITTGAYICGWERQHGLTN